MVEIGKFNILRVTKLVDFGAYLDGEQEGEILLPAAEVPEDCEPGDTIEAFIYFDSEDRLIATRHTPLAQVGEFACLKVVSVENVGAFLDWGLAKDLFLPHAEQTRELKAGYDVIVYVYIDKSGRISASMRTERYLEKGHGELAEGDEVELLVFAKTDLGFKCVINGRQGGMLFANEIFQELGHGQKIRGFVKKLREDGKIDLSLQNPKKTGHRAADDIGPKILESLKASGGFLAINDKTPAETIYEMFGVSKKKYKIALGGLYKNRLITVNDDGIRLV